MDKQSSKYRLNDQFRIKRSTCLDKRIFRPDNVRIIGQANNQVIMCLLTQQRLLLTFDQHAVHERIRYERILTASFDQGYLSGQPVKPPYEISIPEQLSQQLTDEILNKFQRQLNTQMTVRPTDSTVIITNVPVCFGRNFHYPGLFQDFLIDALRYFDSQQQSNSQSSTGHMTPFLVEQIRTQACRGAIRFNEPLSRYECDEMIRALTTCRSSFRCAHGRVLVKPLLYINHINNDQHNHLMNEAWKRHFQPKIDTIIETKNDQIKKQFIK
ncbi:DNA mismatch repair protein Mlh3-like [Dermatophagoides farinae]|uniref:DNA mismatch repair protein Mlh3-like n=1 Tax=Dermatophagoides farinae TaxID=6954 RepID=UPI001F0CE735|nr:DNA mismatch repair protein Mlh3-like [Dermatophagoides farinae]